MGTEESFLSTCPSCGTGIKVPRSAVGRRARCSACNETFDVQRTASRPPPTPPLDALADALDGYEEPEAQSNGRRTRFFRSFYGSLRDEPWRSFPPYWAILWSGRIAMIVGALGVALGLLLLPFDLLMPFRILRETQIPSSFLLGYAIDETWNILIVGLAALAGGQSVLMIRDLALRYLESERKKESTADGKG